MYPLHPLGRLLHAALVGTALLLAQRSVDAVACAAPSSQTAADYVTCKHLIVGGGPGGLLTAWMLRKFSSDVCVVERAPYFGGKMQDFVGPDANPNDGVPGKRIGICAMRINEAQHDMRCLAYQLNVTIQASDFETRIWSRGSWSKGSAAMYQGRKYQIPAQLANVQPPVDDLETALYEYAILATRDTNPITGLKPATHPTKDCARYPSMQSYLRDKLGEEAYAFLQAANGFKGDFEAQLDVCGYIDFFQVDWNRCCTNFYPEGGWSTVWERAVARLKAAGVRMFTSFDANCITKVVGPYPYAVSTTTTSNASSPAAKLPGFLAERLVVAVPPLGVKRLNGDIAGKLNAAKELQAIYPVQTVVYDAFWPRRFWEEPTGLIYSETVGSNFRLLTEGDCIVRSEYPGHPYLREGPNGNGTRPIYTDSPNCVADWKAAFSAGGLSGVTDLVLRDVKRQFGRDDIPKPTAAMYHNQPDAWHYLLPYSSKKGITPASVKKWAAKPIAGEEVCLVGESYNLVDSGWGAGAHVSAGECVRTLFKDAAPGFDAEAAADMLFTCDGQQAPFPNEVPLKAERRMELEGVSGDWRGPMGAWHV